MPPGFCLPHMGPPPPRGLRYRLASWPLRKVLVCHLVSCSRDSTLLEMGTLGTGRVVSAAP